MFSQYLEWGVSDKIVLTLGVRGGSAEPHSVPDISANKVVPEIPHHWENSLESPKCLTMIPAFEEEARQVMDNLSVCQDVEARLW